MKHQTTIHKDRASVIQKIINSRLAKNQLMFILFFSSIITLIGTGLQLFVEYKDDLKYLDIQLSQIETSHLEMLTSSLWTIDNRQIEIQLNNILSLRDIVYLEIIEKGKIIASAGKQSPGDTKFRRYPMVYNRQGENIEIGILLAWASLDGVYQRMLKRLAIILTTQGLKTFIVSLFILFVLYQKVIRHLIRLSDHTREMTLDTLDSPFSLDRRKTGTPDELDSLVDMFNNMRQRLSVDIDTIKETQKALGESEEQLKAILQANPEPLVLYNGDGHPIYINPSFSRVFGWDLSELKGGKIPFVPEDQKEMTAAKIEEIFNSGNPVQFTTRRLTKYNDIIDVIISSALVKDPNGRARGLVVNMTDIREQKKLEAQLQQAQKMESVGRLAGGVAHDFNNMLSIILGNVELLLKDSHAMDDPIAGKLQQIQKAARRSSNLTRQLLAFARKQTISPKILDLNVIIEGMLNMLRRLIGEDIELSWQPKSGLWHTRIDPSQVDQILANLCVNARDAIQDVGKINIETDHAIIDNQYCQVQTEFQPGDYVVLSVSDTGAGMDKETKGKLFEPFFTTKDVGKGTGLGLAMVYGIVRQNDGFINVHSEPGEGTTFKIYLPKQPHTGNDGSKKDSADQILKGNETILVVEDEKAILETTKMMLERVGYTILAANTPEEAIEFSKTQESEIDLLLTDVIMPSMNGRDLVEKISQSRPNLKYLYMSGYTADVISDRGVLDERVNFIGKPFSIKNLSIKLRELLDGPDQ